MPTSNSIIYQLEHLHLEPGPHNVKVIAHADGYLDSDVAELTYVEAYAHLTFNISHGQINASTTIPAQDTTVLQIVPDEDYTYPPSVTIYNAAFTYDSTTGQITLTRINRNTTITASCIPSRSFTVSSGGTSYTFSSITPSGLDTTQYAAYQSSNYHVASSSCASRIDFSGYDTFTIYINSYAESSYDYTYATILDATSYSDSLAISTSGYQYSPSYTSLPNSTWKQYTYTNLGKTAHHIYIVYRKDGSVDSGDDRGRFIIVK